MARYNFLASGYPISGEKITRTSSTASKIGHDLFIAAGFEIWTGAGKTGTKLTLTTDYSYNGENTVYTAKVGVPVYTKLAIVNGAYQNMTLYLTYTTVGDLSNVENTLDIAHPIGSVYFQGPNDADPATLYPGTVWDDVSWEEANLTRRTAGDLAGARFTGIPAHLAYSVTSGVPTVSIINGGSGYLSGGNGTLTLTLVGACTTQATRTATVTNGVITAITTGVAGGGYTAGKFAIYDGVVGHGDLFQIHGHTITDDTSSAIQRTTVASGSGATVIAAGGVNYPIRATTPNSTGGVGFVRSGAETTGAYAVTNKFRRRS